MKITCEAKKMLADTHTPVSIYLKIRDHYLNTILLESNDSKSLENCFSFICADPISTFTIKNGNIQITNYDGSEYRPDIDLSAISALDHFINSFEIDHQNPAFAHLNNGIFGRCSFESFAYFDSFEYKKERKDLDIPDVHYSFYRYVIGIDHFKDELYVIENIPEGENAEIDKFVSLIQSQYLGMYDFQRNGDESSDLSDEDFIEMVKQAKAHCKRGDVFQLVLSRRFEQSFMGDDFNVYRALRSINPSPYLFYFDYGNYKLFGSSPEAQLIVKDGIAEVNPIAGTYKRTGKDEEDRNRAMELLEDPKENAEHIMLVDLARNDLGKNCQNVTVKELMEIEYFSHVIHLVSKVTGKLKPGTSLAQILADTFPAGTLSGAPKYKAIELIEKYEKTKREFYGGTIGFIDFNGNLNHAIVIRSFLSKHNTLYYQSGAGIVNDSVEVKELGELDNKLAALKNALVMAENIKLQVQ